MTPEILQTNAEDVDIDIDAHNVHQLALLDLRTKSALFAKWASPSTIGVSVMLIKHDSCLLSCETETNPPDSVQHA